MLNPSTPLGQLHWTLEQLDLVLLMSVNPGFGGQSFIPHVLDKLRKVREMIDASGRDIRLEVDGGVKVDNIGEIAAAGADTFVAGSAIFRLRRLPRHDQPHEGERGLSRIPVSRTAVGGHHVAQRSAGQRAVEGIAGHQAEPLGRAVDDQFVAAAVHHLQLAHRVPAARRPGPLSSSRSPICKLAQEAEMGVAVPVDDDVLARRRCRPRAPGRRPGCGRCCPAAPTAGRRAPAALSSAAPWCPPRARAVAAQPPASDSPPTAFHQPLGQLGLERNPGGADRQEKGKKSGGDGHRRVKPVAGSSSRREGRPWLASATGMPRPGGRKIQQHAGGDEQGEQGQGQAQRASRWPSAEKPTADRAAGGQQAGHRPRCRDLRPARPRGRAVDGDQAGVGRQQAELQGQVRGPGGGPSAGSTPNMRLSSSASILLRAHSVARPSPPAAGLTRPLVSQ